MAAKGVYFVHISDTHIGTTEGFTRHGHATLPSARKMVEIINTMPVRPDFVVHTGDVVADPQSSAYKLAAEAFAPLEVPIYYVNGNHDTAASIRDYLPMGPSEPAGGDFSRLSYSFDVKSFRFLVLDARGPDEIDPHGHLPESQIELIAQEATTPGPPLAIFIHYPILPLNSIWMDNNMLVLNGEEMHRALLPARNRLRGVFHGHVHQHMQTTKDGIQYFSVASVFSQFTAWPNDADVRFDPAHEPGYGFVHLLPEQTIVHQHTFPRPKQP
ncbi:MAG TPA: metallophosphoesterase [candidate division Zixibacteria bacterium]|nr:metallophosphoesterase [candidate division Zixibacteria bacterium]